MKIPARASSASRSPRLAVCAFLLGAIQLPLSAATITPTGDMVLKRYRATTTLLPDGQILVAGGSGSSSTTASMERYDPATGVFSETGPLSEPRENAVAVALPNGKVLFVGGRESNGTSSTLASAELYDPASGQSAAITGPGQRRADATATLLADGRVLIAGGHDSGSGGSDGDPGIGDVGVAQIYDPVTGSFSATGSMITSRSGAAAVLLRDGRVLFVGGDNFDNGFAATLEIYDPESGQFVAAATMPGPARYGPVVTLLADNKVLIAGGHNTASALLYDVAGNTFESTGSMLSARGGASAALLPDGSVLVAGGRSGSFTAPTAIERYLPWAGEFVAAGELESVHAGAAFSLLPDGRALIAGGYIPPPDGNHGMTLLAKAEVIDTRTPQVSAAASLDVARRDPAASALPDGDVLIAGGFGQGGQPIASAERYDSASGTFVAVGAPLQPRSHASVALMPQGKVAFVGGEVAEGSALDTAEIYDPATHAFTAVGSRLRQARTDAASALLADGRLLVVGGRASSGIPLASAELFDGHTRTFRRGGNLSTARSEASATLLPNGQVLVAGGRGLAGVLNKAELYDPVQRSFSEIAGLSLARRGANAVLLPNGLVLIAGGRGDNNDNAPPQALASAELYDPASNSFAPTGAMTTPRFGASTRLLGDGRVWFAGGIDASGNALASTEVYDPQRGEFSAGPSLGSARALAATALLPRGQMLLAGGGNQGNALAGSEIFDPDAIAGLDAFRPELDPPVARLELPGTLMLEGIGLRGSNRFVGGSVAGSEGGNGSSYSSAANLPLLRLERIDNQQVFFQHPDPANPWADQLFVTPELARFDPLNLFDPNARPVGTYRVSVIANGIASEARQVSLYWIGDAIFASGFEADE